jgi:hypothetical protein
MQTSYDTCQVCLCPKAHLTTRHRQRKAQPQLTCTITWCHVICKCTAVQEILPKQQPHRVMTTCWRLEAGCQKPKHPADTNTYTHNKMGVSIHVTANTKPAC